MFLSKWIAHSIAMTFRCYEGEGDGAAGGGDGAGAGDGKGGGDGAGGGEGDKGGENVADLFANAPVRVSDDLEDDPEMAEAIKAANAAMADDGKGDKDGKGGKKPDDAGDGDKMGAGADDKGGDADKDKNLEDENTKYSFEGDLEIGDVKFTKDALNELPTPVLENLGKMKTKIDSLSEQVANAQTRSDELLNDPVVKERDKAIRDGRANEPYATGMTKEAHTAISAALKKLDLDEAEIETFFKEVLIKEYSQDLEFSTANAVKNRVTTMQREENLTQNRNKSFDLLRDCLQHNQNLAVEEKDFSKFFTVDDKGRVTGFDKTHPEYKKFSEGPMKIFDYWATKRKTSWADFVQLSTKEIYAAAAAANNLPVAINTESRDQNIVQGERQKIIESLGGKRVADAMSNSGKASSSQDSAAHASLDNQGAIDDSKLDDPEYVDQLMTSAETEEDLLGIHKMLKNRVMNRK